MEAVVLEAVRPCATTSENNHQTRENDRECSGNRILNNEEGFARALHADPVDIRFEKVTYSASLGFRKGTKRILHEINGYFPQGQLIAIMGPSGAGKSTLLNVLSGYSIQGVEGNVYVNGIVRNLKLFRKLSCYITQDDRLQPLLTIGENMRTAADFKLGVEVTSNEKDKIIEEILATLGLSKATNTRASMLSGGQKKRLSIALELINNPLVMFLDEPTTGLDSLTCTQTVKLLKTLTSQGRTIICTIHQPSASLFNVFDQVYVLAFGKCLYQGSTDNLVPFLERSNLPCPIYHNPADYIIELACGEYGEDKIDRLSEATLNGQSVEWFARPEEIRKQICLLEDSKHKKPLEIDNGNIQATSQYNQLKVLLRRGFLKSHRDSRLTYTRIGVNVLVAVMLGTLYWKAGIDGSKVLDNYNLLFSILMHHMMSTMMLTILTFPSDLSILIKEHFNRWYSLKMYYASVTLVDIPISVFCAFIFTIILYVMSAQPLEVNRFFMFATISTLVVFVAQSFGLMIGAVCNVINGTFLGPTLSVPMMMFAGFGVAIKDLPVYLYWGSYISYLRYGLEGIVDAVYGMDRPTLACPEDKYCHYRYPTQFLKEISMKGDQFWNDIIALTIMLFFLRIVAYVLLRWKLMSVR